jgi:hypothetical protein
LEVQNKGGQSSFRAIEDKRKKKEEGGAEVATRG